MVFAAYGPYPLDKFSPKRDNLAMRNFLLLGLGALFGTVGTVHAASPAQVETPQATVTLISEFETAAPGVAQWIGVHFKPKAGWHVYWKNPGDSGLPPRGEFASSIEGAKFGPIEFPTPDRIPYGPLVNFGYEGEVLYPIRWTPSEQAPIGGSTTVTAQLKWLICKEECVPGKGTFKLELPVVSSEVFASSPSTDGKLFKATIAALPVEARNQVRVVLAPSEEQVEIAYTGDVSKVKPSSVFFFHEGEYGIGSDVKQTVTKNADGLRVVIPRKEKKPLGEIRGILKLGQGRGVLVSEVINPALLKPKAKPSPAATAAPQGLGLMLVFAFLGGLILNLMPCILPVLSIKVMEIASQAGAGKRSVRKHGLVFTLGVLVSFWILAAILLSVRASGQSLGWGFQLQSPVFIGILAVLFFLMALNLFGFFEIGTRIMGTGGKLAAKDGYAGSFFTGVLTTVAATPCSAPFMGSALGFALTQSAFVAVLVLTVLALGLAFPYLLFSFLPNAAKVLPRPGMWMKSLKEFLAFPLLATVVWLVGVLGNQSGNEGVVQLLAVLVLSTAVIWLYNQRTERFIPRAAKGSLILVFTALALAILTGLGKLRKSATQEGAEMGMRIHAPWKAWSPEALETALSSGKTVLVNVTADWCVTCKVNETVAFERDAVKARLGSDDVVALLADWTNGSAVVTEYMAKHGRNSVPVYLLYKKGSRTPVLLPQILSADQLLKDLEK